MRFLFRMMTAFALFISALAAPAMAEDNASARLQRLMPYFEKFMDIPANERDLIWLAYRVKSRSQAETDIRAWYTLNGQQYDLRLNERGELIDLPSLSVYRANPVVYTNVPKKDAVYALRVRPNVPLTTSMDAATLTASLKQADKGIRRMSGMFGFFKPDLKGYRFEIPTGSTAEMVFPNGEVRALTVTRIDPRVSHVDVDRKELARASTVRFSSAPFLLKYKE